MFRLYIQPSSGLKEISPGTRRVWGTLLVAQLFEALRYKPEGRVFDSRWCHWNVSLTQSFRLHYDPGVHSASNGNKYQEYFLGVKTAGA
jgi:hypothetical protein